MPVQQIIEELSMNAWPSLQTRLYDGWILRFSDGYTKRANSINPLYPSTIDLEEKISFCETVYEHQDLPVVFKLIEDYTQPEIENILDTRNYTRLDETIVMTKNLGSINHDHESTVIIEHEFHEEWEKGFESCNKIDPKYHKVLSTMLHNIKLDTIIVSKKSNDVLIGCGFGALEHGYVGIFDIVVDEMMRGKGIGKEMVLGILGTAQEMDVKTAYLQVLAHNTIAKNLYTKLGFEERYRYWYRKKI